MLAASAASAHINFVNLFIRTLSFLCCLSDGSRD